MTLKGEEYGEEYVFGPRRNLPLIHESWYGWIEVIGGKSSNRTGDLENLEQADHENKRNLIHGPLPPLVKMEDENVFHPPPI